MFFEHAFSLFQKHLSYIKRAVLLTNRPFGLANSLFETGNFADATVQGLKKNWSVHKVMLVGRSTFFRDAFAAVAPDNTVKVDDHDDDDIEMVLRFVYAGSMPPFPHINPPY